MKLRDGFVRRSVFRLLWGSIGFVLFVIVSITMLLRGREFDMQQELWSDWAFTLKKGFL